MVLGHLQPTCLNGSRPRYSPHNACHTGNHRQRIHAKNAQLSMACHETCKHTSPYGPFRACI